MSLLRACLLWKSRGPACLLDFFPRWVDLSVSSAGCPGSESLADGEQDSPWLLGRPPLHVAEQSGQPAVCSGMEEGEGELKTRMSSIMLGILLILSLSLFTTQIQHSVHS